MCLRLHRSMAWSFWVTTVRIEASNAIELAIVQLSRSSYLFLEYVDDTADR